MSETYLLGEKELDEALRKLAPMIAGKKGYPKNPLRNAARAGAKLVEDKTRSNAPVGKTGRLKKAITKKIMSTQYRDKYTLAGDSAEYYFIGVKKGKSRDDENGAWYAPFVEKGTPGLGSRAQKANPFMRRSFAQTKKASEREIAERLRKDLIRIAKKIGDENTRALLSKGIK